MVFSGVVGGVISGDFVFSVAAVDNVCTRDRLVAGAIYGYVVGVVDDGVVDGEDEGAVVDESNGGVDGAIDADGDRV